MSAILDVRISLSIAFLAILDQYATLILFLFLTNWLRSAILDVRISLSIAFLALSDRYATLIIFEIFNKMAAVGHFGCHHISGHFRSIQIFIFFDFFLQNGCRWPFWMSENHFRSHFYPFHIDTQLNFFEIFDNG